MHGIEDFDKGKLAHAEPQVKNPLPDTDSMSLFFYCSFIVPRSIVLLGYSFPIVLPVLVAL